MLHLLTQQALSFLQLLSPVARVHMIPFRFVHATNGIIAALQEVPEAQEQGSYNRIDPPGIAGAIGGA